jgi:quercetin dioxygenase-like cupin family protein
MEKTVMNHFISLEKLELQELIKGGFVGSVQTENLTIAYTDMKAGAEIPLHQHLEEAVDIVLYGELKMQIGNNTGLLRPGMMSLVPSNVPHMARAITDCKVATIFYPRRGL